MEIENDQLQARNIADVRISGEKEDEKPEEKTTSEERVWKSCCGCKWSIQAVKYTATYLISLLVLIFAMVMISTESQDGSRFPIWVSIISGIASQYMPSPITF